MTDDNNSARPHPPCPRRGTTSARRSSSHPSKPSVANIAKPTVGQSNRVFSSPTADSVHMSHSGCGTIPSPRPRATNAAPSSEREDPLPEEGSTSYLDADPPSARIEAAHSTVYGSSGASTPARTRGRSHSCVWSARGASPRRCDNSNASTCPAESQSATTRGGIEFHLGLVPCSSTVTAPTHES